MFFLLMSKLSDAKFSIPCSIFLVRDCKEKSYFDCSPLTLKPVNKEYRALFDNSILVLTRLPWLNNIIIIIIITAHGLKSSGEDDEEEDLNEEVSSAEEDEDDDDDDDDDGVTGAKLFKGLQGLPKDQGMTR